MMVTGIIGGTVLLQCTVEGNPQPSITWLINGSMLDVALQGSIIEDTIGLITYNSQLTLTMIDLNDIGQYSCNATNNLVEFRNDVSNELALEVLRK